MNLIFDVGGVLIDLDYDRAFKQLGEYLNPLTAMLIWAKKDEFMQEMQGEIDLLETGKMNMTQFFSRLKGRIGLKLAQEQFEEIWNSALQPNDEMLAFAGELCTHVPCYCASNTNETHAAYMLTQCPQLGQFKGMAFSHELGVKKPTAEFFQGLCARFGVEPSTCVFIDDRDGNVDAAVASGMAGIHFQGLAGLRTALGERGVACGAGQ
jgi:putative hydrolase of the HAD superfamily